MSFLRHMTLLLCALPIAAAADASFDVSARLEAGATPDRMTLVVEVESSQPIGEQTRHPLLQLDLPVGVTPVESMLEPDSLEGVFDHLDFHAGFPWGRVMRAPRVEIPLRVEGETARGIGVNVTTYLDGETPDDATFVRRRLQLDVRAGAVAREVEPTVTTWGPGGLVHVGDPAKDFDLPAGDGERLVLSEELAEGRPIFLLTYRSDW